MAKKVHTFDKLLPSVCRDAEREVNKRLSSKAKKDPLNKFPIGHRVSIVRDTNGTWAVCSQEESGAITYDETPNKAIRRLVKALRSLKDYKSKKHNKNK